MWRIVFFLLIVPSFGCNNKQPDHELTDSAAVAAKNAKEDSTVMSTQGVTEWVQETMKSKTSTPKLTWEEQWKGDDLIQSPFSPESDFYTIYKSVLRWSPDSNYILDIGSYGAVVTSDRFGNSALEQGEPDTELALIEPKTQQRTRLMFVGPSSNILDAKWMSNNKAMVIGTFDKTGNHDNDTLVWVIDVTDKLFRLYNVKSHP